MRQQFPANRERPSLPRYPTAGKIARRGAERIATDRWRLAHADAAIAAGLMDTRARRHQCFKAAIDDQCFQRLARRRIDIERDFGGNVAVAYDFGGDRKVAPAGIG